MTWTGDFYSQLVAWMKIILPLAALGLLSTLFLISRTIDPTQQPATVEVDLEQRAHEQGATKPSFAGVTGGGDEVSFLADRARPDLRDPERLIADEITSELRLLGGTVIDITADHADMHQRHYTASMEGRVNIVTTNGYTLTTDRLNTRFDVLYASSPGPVQGSGPPGEIKAGRMVLSTNEDTGDAEMVFTDGVNLIYQPNNPEE
ncbi:LPS export ABC transporter periplasmic protein LptC [Roseovarius sp. 2305UL8-3]|uniref:LPS export ABC transporter periplasmic protein LptC n=1 Tax=Roseovarius conchicola TaxID=3121636 RepID=UPI0035284C72